jgi:TATA-binding protein-associated factor
MLRVIMTATPIHTSTKDGASMGRLIGESFFFTKDALLEEKSDATHLRKAKESNGSEEGDGPTCTQVRQMEIAQRLQRQFKGRILRRTADSQDNEGKPLIQLIPYKEVMVIVKLTEREMEIVQEHADDVKAR